MSLRDRVAVVGVGTTHFGEHFDRSYSDLLHEACFEAFGMAGVGASDIQAAWLGTCFPDMGGFEGNAGSSLAHAIGVYGIPISRVVNYCSTGMDAFRNACFAVAAGIYDVVLVAGVEKMRDVPSRESLVAQVVETGHPLHGKGITAPGIFAMCATAYFSKWGTSRELLAQIAIKNHANGALNPKAHLRREVTLEQVMRAPFISEPLGLYDCCPTTDGAAASIIIRPDLVGDRAHVLVKGIGLAVGSSDFPFFDPSFDFLGFRSTRDAAREAYTQAGVQASDIGVAEVHDCFTITELLNYEDLGFCERGSARRLIEERVTRIGGRLPVNPSGGLKACGHPIGASGIRMLSEITLQLLGLAGDRQVAETRLGLAHNLGGPGAVACVSILGLPDGAVQISVSGPLAAPQPLPMDAEAFEAIDEAVFGQETVSTLKEPEDPIGNALRELEGSEEAAAEAAVSRPLDAAGFFESATDWLKPDAGDGQPLVLQFDLSGHRGGSWTLIIADGTALLDPSQPRPAAVVSASVEDFEAILAGRMSDQMAFMTGRFKIRGDMAEGMRFRTIFQLGRIPVPNPTVLEGPSGPKPLPEPLRSQTSASLGDITRQLLPDQSRNLAPDDPSPPDDEP